MGFLNWLQNLPYSIWLNESSSVWGYPMFLFLHTLGMSIVAGGTTMISFALLGLWPKAMPIRPLERIFPFLFWGFAVNVFTGVSILMKDATTTGANPDFYIKMVFVFVGFGLLLAIRRRVFRNPDLDVRPLPGGARLMAWGSLICWFAAIVAGRLIAYVGPVAGV